MAQPMRTASIILILVISLIGFGCEKELKDPDKEELYKGPLLENHDIVTLVSDSAELQIKLMAPVQQEFEEGDGVFPKGLYVEFYGQPDTVTSTLRANYGKQERKKDIYVARGNVEVENRQKHEKLETEELYWDKRKAQIYTDKQVRVTTPEQIITGKGLRAKQDFSHYTVQNVTGVFSLNE